MKTENELQYVQIGNIRTTDSIEIVISREGVGNMMDMGRIEENAMNISFLYLILYTN